MKKSKFSETQIVSILRQATPDEYYYATPSAIPLAV